ncbi:MAG TPA: methyltransferase domain-containing protein [Caldilineae bacterium]|nr:methyltransferase domain-containing protein [Caldilineae bacterium]
MIDPATVRIEDRDGLRHVTIEGRQFGFGGAVNRSKLTTHYTRELLEMILEAKGAAWLRDEVMRTEDPDYIERPLGRLIERFVSIAGKTVLDFGCGCGASSIALARLGAAEVYGIEPDPAFAEIARRRVAEDGLEGRVHVHHVPDTTRLPLPDGSVDLAVCNAVLEHIPPRHRPAHLREIWRTLRPGGHLIISETPNRLWPKDHHTTGLWWVPYMPLRLARRYAIWRSDRVSPECTVEQLVADGIRGVTYWEIRRALGPGAICLNVVRGDDIAVYARTSLARPGQSRKRRLVKSLVWTMARAVEMLILRRLRIPGTALMPELTLCLCRQEG